MTTIETTRSATFDTLVTSTVMSIYRIADAFSAWNDARVTRKALSRLSARELDDIGLCRDDIDRVSRTTV